MPRMIIVASNYYHIIDNIEIDRFYDGFNLIIQDASKEIISILKKCASIISRNQFIYLFIDEDSGFTFEGEFYHFSEKEGKVNITLQSIFSGFSGITEIEIRKAWAYGRIILNL